MINFCLPQGKSSEEYLTKKHFALNGYLWHARLTILQSNRRRIQKIILCAFCCIYALSNNIPDKSALFRINTFVTHFVTNKSDEETRLLKYFSFLKFCLRDHVSTWLYLFGFLLVLSSGRHRNFWSISWMSHLARYYMWKKGTNG